MNKVRNSDMFIEKAPMVYIGDLIDEITCQNIIAEFANDADWITAQITTYVEDENGQEHLKSITDFDRRQARRIHFSDINMDVKSHTQATLSTIKDKVSVFLAQECGFYTNDFGDEEIVRYPQGGCFTAHTDANKLKPYRALTVVLYLNDNYEGGKTDFPSLQYACTPKTGRVLVFDSRLLHAGNTILSGEKFIMVFWAFYPGGK